MMTSAIEKFIPLNTDKNTSIFIDKSFDINLDNLIKRPEKGTLVSEGTTLKYQPNIDITGDDTLSFRSNQNGNKEIVFIIKINETIFKPRARMLLQLGDQLIKNENIALLELVKNSYDANATQVTILMENIDVKQEGIIQIEDNGDGMDKNIVTNVWMEPGSDHKAQKIKEINKKPLNSIEGRIPIGEKGIGRFGVHKLGSVIEMYTKKEGAKEVHVKINWADFKVQRYLSDVPVKITENDKPIHFKNGKTGTFIQIEKLRTAWDRRMVRNAYRAIGSLKSPFDISMYGDDKEAIEEDFFKIKSIKNDDFKIHFEVETFLKENWLEGIVSFDDFAHHSLYSLYAEVKDDEVKTFNYRFTPWNKIKSIEGRSIDETHPSLNNLLDLVLKAGKKETSFSIKDKGIGKIKMRGLVFDLSSNLNPFGLKGIKKSLSDYLKFNGGVKVFRDGMRIYNYGEKDADWLGLDIKRVNSPSTSLSNNLIIVEVHIDRLDSYNLREKTNREGFVENNIYELFRNSVIHTLNLLAICRNPDKARLREVTGISPKSEPVLSVIEDTKYYINNDLKEVPEKKKKKLLYNLNQIGKHYQEINEIYQTAAGAGLNMSVVVHEIEKIIKEIQYTLKIEKASEKVMELIAHVEKLVDGYSTLIKRTGIRKKDLQHTIASALFNVSYRLKAHKVEIVKNYNDNPNEPFIVEIADNLLSSALLNIIDNSIYWMSKSGREEKKIFINIEKDKQYTHLVIADNGTGFTIPTETMTKPFVSGKIGGMGLGLHITNEIIQGMKADLIFPDWGDYAIPKEYENGAIIAIQFKNPK